MIAPPLTLGRIYARLDIQPKSLLYYDRRAAFASRYSPNPYPHWELSPTLVQLVDQPARRRVQLQSGSIAFDADKPRDVSALQQHIGDLMEAYIEDLAGEAKLQRLGWRAVFVTEHTSFEDLLSSFRQNTLRHERSWAQVEAFTIRDLGFTAIYYGTEENGLKLGLGVLTGEQGKKLQKATGFSQEDSELAVEQGALMIDLDRYVQDVERDQVPDVVFREHERLIEIANRMATSVLR